MSDRDPGVDRYARDPHFPSDWPDETEASVFRRPSQHGRGLRSHPPQSPAPAYSAPTSAHPAGHGDPLTAPYSWPQASPVSPTYPPAYPPTEPVPQQATIVGRSPYASDAYLARSAYAPEPGYPTRSTPAEVARRALQEQLARDEESQRARDARRRFPLGLGAFLGVAGVTCLLLALMVLPWFEVEGEDVTRSDLEAALAIPEADAADVVPDASDAVPTSLPPGVPSPGEVGEAVEQQARDTVGEAATAAIDEGRRRYLEIYTDTLWMAVAGAAGGAVLFSTILTPRSRLLSLMLGLRVIAGIAVVAAGAAHGVALWVVFGGDGAPEPATGVWLGVGGLGAVLLAAIVGPKR